jgi:hypothetical protein
MERRERDVVEVHPFQLEDGDSFEMPVNCYQTAKCHTKDNCMVYETISS